MTHSSRTRLRFGSFELDLNTRELRKSGVRVKLSGQPLEILTALLERPGQLVSREELRKRVWAEDTFVDFGHGLNAAMNKLREALCDSADEPRYIETLPRRGYRFIATIQEIPEPPEIAQSLPAAPTFSSLPANTPRDLTLVDEGWQTLVPIKRQTLVHLFATLAVLLLLTLAIVHAGLNWYQSNSAEISERSMKFAAERGFSSLPPAIWHVDLAHATEPEAQTRVISLGHEAIGGPQPSPDGKRLAFSSGTTETGDIWVSNSDGSDPKQLTTMGHCGVPRWSPDSRWIAFDTDGRGGHSAILVVDLETGAIREVVKDRWNNDVPSWSRDGRWIYFASNRAAGGEQNQVWKISVDAGQLAQVTRHGGFSAYESLDGHTLYYAKNRYENPEIWQVPSDGGEEKRVSSLVRPSTWANWSITDQGILFLGDYTQASSTLEFFDFSTHGVRPLRTLEKASFWLSSSLDGKSIWYSDLTDNQARQVFRAGFD